MRVAENPVILAAESYLPEHHVDQEALVGVLRGLWEKQDVNLDRLEKLHRAVKVGGRYLALPLTEYAKLDSFARCNDAWIKAGRELGALAVERSLATASLTARDVNHFFCVTTTGIAVPSLDARIVNRLGIRTDVKRTPIFGLGCAGGAAGVARAADWLRAFPEEVAVVLSVELCSLTLQRDDVSMSNIIASGLFGDGAAAVVLGGAARFRGQGPRVLATQSAFYPDTERVMGWDVVDTGFKVVLSAQVPTIARELIAGSVDSFLRAHDLSGTEIRHWICHPGGPRVLEALQAALDLPREKLERSWHSLEAIGNISSASVLFLLGDLLEAREAKKGEFGLLLAMGPGFCSELVLLEW